MNDTPTIRILGDLRASRADGTEVLPDEWRTAKTRDLVCLLVLAGDRPVRVPLLLERLWPGVAEDPARNRLRTAASQIRHTMREPGCLVRESDMLRLDGVTTDVETFRAVARRARMAARIGASADVLDEARAAQVLYRGDFHAHDDDSPWAVEERGRLQRLLRETLRDAGVAALDLDLPREALDLARATLALDPTSETAHRTLMEAHARLGEVATALRVFEAYRSHLADELGVDPSPQTIDLHLRLLQGFTPDAARTTSR